MTRATPPDDAEDAPDEAHDTDEAHVEELRERIARGEYRVDPEAIARRILERADLEAAADEPGPPALRLVGDAGDAPGEPAIEAVDEPSNEQVEETVDEIEGESDA